ncbi:PTS sugar transporter subunit IIB [Olsenella sp. YH-ols2217]|uniref:PTS sugar transporter subunit IIB n=1 Tax=Kribbibacterium absianum TaxID=3044210 RepID=A0ABT6ZIX3_9ACTN|nr:MULTISPECIES: PTS sugar transporter subunit IIB [unclassified Olsenella]MDJ1121511.1 PTS sugar transporter subunit IIB [Olsenella sp. YH-ols2216]MDJ1129001.1 PTS sugar transporter subunit IIB [Olsenella sp. YH-ols2217]
MTSILVACGSGIATSTAVCNKIKDLLDTNGHAGDYTIKTTSIADAVPSSASADLVIATTVKPDGIECEFINGIPFLTGIGRQAVEQQILDFMANR